MKDKKMMLLSKNFFFSSLFLALAACQASSMSDIGGGTEAGNPPAPTREVRGSVEEDENGTCAATSVVADPEDNPPISEQIGPDCRFSLSLEINHAYEISFENSGVFVARLVFDSNPDTFPATFLYLAAGDTAIDLGTITFDGAEATAANSPSTQNDQDGDGISDYEDTDDNNDETSDTDEEDCDLDGVIDVNDNDISSCSPEEEEDGETSPSRQVVEVTPRNNSINIGENADIGARFNCTVDTATVNTTTFSVASEGEFLDCDYIFANEGKVVLCAHDETNLISLASYTAVIDGIDCTDGAEVNPESWSWTTLDLGIPGL